jgi:hypothetical protein
MPDLPNLRALAEQLARDMRATRPEHVGQVVEHRRDDVRERVRRYELGGGERGGRAHEQQQPVLAAEAMAGFHGLVKPVSTRSSRSPVSSKFSFRDCLISRIWLAISARSPAVNGWLSSDSSGATATATVPGSKPSAHRSGTASSDIRAASAAAPCACRKHPGRECFRPRSAPQLAPRASPQLVGFAALRWWPMMFLPRGL